MPDYLARVVLHRMDDSDDYVELHAEMLKIGFRQRVLNQDPRFPSHTLKMPAGTYYFDHNIPVNSGRLATVDVAYQAVANAVDEVVKDKSKYVHDANNPPTILVVQTVTARWFLEVV